jgi:hypothetical protein
MRQKKGINKYHTFMKRGQKGSPKILEPVLLEDQVKTENEETRKTQSTRRKIS